MLLRGSHQLGYSRIRESSARSRNNRWPLGAGHLCQAEHHGISCIKLIRRERLDFERGPEASPEDRIAGESGPTDRGVAEIDSASKSPNIVQLSNGALRLTVQPSALASKSQTNPSRAAGGIHLPPDSPLRLPHAGNAAKGLEFRAVAVMACDDEVIPVQEQIETVGDDADLQEVYDTERHLLYVACTRARDSLLVTAVEPASEFLDDLRL